MYIYIYTYTYIIASYRDTHTDISCVKCTGYIYAKQKHPGYKKGARPIRSNIANRYVRPKTLISVEAKKLLIKNLLE